MIDQVVEGRWTAWYRTKSKLKQRFLQKKTKPKTKPKCYKWYFWIATNDFLQERPPIWWTLPSWADLFHHLMASARTRHCPVVDAFGKVENLTGLHNRSKERTFFGRATNLVTILCTFLLLEWYYCNTWTKTEIFRALSSYDPTHDELMSPWGHFVNCSRPYFQT